MKASDGSGAAEDREHQRRLQATRVRVARIAWWLDDLVALPGTRFCIGIDSIIGLIPGIGDFAGMVLGGAILLEGFRAQAPNRLILRMLANTATDGLVGSVPVFGDLFDFAYRSNAKNARLLLTHLDTQVRAPAGKPARRIWLLVLVLIVPVAVFALAVAGLIAVFQRLFHP